MKKLPIGIQTFSDIIQDDYLYIDKTEVIASLIKSGKYYFLSRPRRFGKSLLISTLKDIFCGNQELFKGLYIYDKISWEKHPVIHIDFSFITYDKTAKIFEDSLSLYLKSIAKDYDIFLTTTSIKDQFRELVSELSKTGKVVVLIDEYDKPIIDFITDLKKAKANREILQNFFSVLKGADPWVHFVFITGVSRFSKVSIFSGLNNLNDITLSDRFTQLTGITEKELSAYFDDRIEELCRISISTKNEIMQRIQYWYNGYSWDSIHMVYNPTSLLNLFFNYSFNNYWFATGTPSFLISFIKEKKVDVSFINKKIVSASVFESYDIDNIGLYALLFQTGYLTISEIKEKKELKQYLLSFPNFEVRESLLNHLLASFSGNEVAEIQPMYLQLLDYLEEKKIEKFQTTLNALFARIPSHLHIKHEYYYHSLCYMILTLMGARLDMEVLSDKGRMDAVLEMNKIIYVIEFKMGTAKQALAQIKERRYLESFLDRKKEIYLLGVGGFKEKKIECLLEKVG